MKLHPSVIDYACKAVAFKLAEIDGVTMTSEQYHDRIKMNPDVHHEMKRYIEAGVLAALANMAPPAFWMIYGQYMTQLEKGHTLDDDLKNNEAGSVVGGASAYALWAASILHPQANPMEVGEVPDGWSWPKEDFHPVAPGIAMGKAGAMIVSELHRYMESDNCGDVKNLDGSLWGRFQSNFE